MRWAAVLVSALGCGPALEAVDAGADAPLADAAASLRCDPPDEVCPLHAPAVGAPCVGALVCPYAESEYSMYESSCALGQWTVRLTCAAGTTCFPPLVELCDAPFAGTLDGATVEIGPPDEDRPYEDGERVTNVIGAQGLPMFPFAVRITGVEAPPTCIEYTLDMSFDSGVARTSRPRTMTLYCGVSRTAFWNPPDLECTGEVGVEVVVHVTGVGDSPPVHVVAVGEGGGFCP